MPTYDYLCKKCGFEFEQFQSMKDDPIQDCPECKTHGSVQRLIGCGAGIIFKGSGFYETDYKRQSPPTETSGEQKETSKSEDTSKTKTDDKTETKAKKETSGTNGKVKKKSAA